MDLKRILSKFKISPHSATGLLLAATSGIISLVLLSSASRFHGQTQDVRVRNAAALIRDAAAHCYVIEGRYPDDIDYLVRNYGVILEREKYAYTYRVERGRPYIEVAPR